MTFEIHWEARAVTAASRYLADDHDGLAQVFRAADLLAAEPAPEGSFAYGSPTVRRIHVGLYRLLYEIFEETGTIQVIHLGRVD